MVKKQAEEYYLMHKDVPVCLMELSVDGRLGKYISERTYANWWANE